VGSGVGGRAVLSIHTRVSDHETTLTASSHTRRGMASDVTGRGWARGVRTSGHA
jgi:hypothetical protein